MSWKLKNGLKLETTTRFKLQIHWKSGLKNYEELMEIAKENCKRWNIWLKFQSRKWSDCNMIGNLQISSTKINWIQRLNQISQPDWNVIQNINSKVKVIVMRFLTHEGIDENCGGNKVWNLQVNGWNAKFGRLFLENRFCICKFLWYYRNLLYVLPDDIFWTGSVRVKLVVHFFVLFAVIARKREVGRSSFVPEGPKQIHRTLNHWWNFSCAVIAGLVNSLTLSVKWTPFFRQPYHHISIYLDFMGIAKRARARTGAAGPIRAAFAQSPL